RRVLVWHYRQTRAMRDVDRPMVRRVGRVALITLVLLEVRLPLLLSFYVSRPFLRAVAVHEYEELPYIFANENRFRSQQCGVFRVTLVLTDLSGVAIDVLPNDWFVYKPHSKPSFLNYLMGDQLTPQWIAGGDPLNWRFGWWIRASLYRWFR